MLRRLGILALVAACDPAGLTLEVVVDDPEIDKVELFVGDGCGSDCPRGTKPPDLGPIPVDAAFVVADPEPFVVVANEFQDGVAGFRIESSEDTSLPILVAVGYDAQDRIRWSATFHDVAVPHEDSAYWRIEMAPTLPIAENAPQPAGTERIEMWRDPGRQLPACLLIEHWGDQGATRELIGPLDDHDCDDVDPANECAPWIPNATGALPTLDTASCLVPEPQANGKTVCMLGGPQCNETEPQNAACVPLEEPYCTPIGLCACAGDGDTVACVTEALLDAVSNATPMPHLECRILIDEDRNRCGGSRITIDATEYLGEVATCTSMGFNELAAPVGPFEDHIALGTAKLELEDFSEPCRADVTWVPGDAPPATYAVLGLSLDNGYHLVVPALIEVLHGCDMPLDSSCELVTTSVANDETMWDCVGAPPVPLCLPDSQHGCAGPMCGGKCCGPGEACGVDGCTCGGGPACEVSGDTCRSTLVMENQCGTVCCGASQPCPL